MAPRTTIARRIADLVGADRFLIEDVGAGWPVLSRVKTNGTVREVAAFVAPVTGSNRGLDHRERRIQNPEAAHRRTIVVPQGRIGIVLGLWEGDTATVHPSDRISGTKPVLMALDTRQREGQGTRYSIFVGRDSLVSAMATGWSDYKSATGEVITCCYPTLLPAYLETLAAGVAVSADSMRSIVSAAGVGANASDDPEERVRRACLTLVRDARFGQSVLRAYGGRCAMCDLNSGLVEGAHIYPASAPGSQDQVWNGLALCCNHHAAFDRHLFYIDPSSRAVQPHPTLTEHAQESTACHALLTMTRDNLSEPRSQHDRPHAAMFDQRYAHFEEAYSWAR